MEVYFRVLLLFSVDFSTPICPSSVFGIQTLRRNGKPSGHKHPVKPKDMG